MNINLIYPQIPAPLDRHIPGTAVTACQILNTLTEQIKHQLQQSANLNIILQLGASAQDGHWHTASGFTVTSQPGSPQSDQLSDLCRALHSSRRQRLAHRYLRGRIGFRRHRPLLIRRPRAVFLYADCRPGHRDGSHYYWDSSISDTANRQNVPQLSETNAEYR